MKQRLAWVDLAKGIGIVLVVYGHVVRGVINAGLVADPSFLLWLDRVIYGFHMPLFFFLAGIFFFDSIGKRGVVGYVGGKLDTLVYPYLLWSVFQGSIEILFDSYTNASIHWGDVFSLLWKPRAQFWFLYGLFFCSIFAAIVWYMVRNGILRVGWIFFVFGVLGILVSPWLGFNAITRYVSLYFIFFALGVLWNFGDKLRLEFYVFGLMLSLGVAGLILLAVPNADLGDNRWVKLLFAVAGVFVVVFLSLFFSRYNLKIFNFLAVLGNYSLAIYLMHIFAGSGIRIVLQYGLRVENVSTHVIVGCLVGLGVPWLVADRLDAWGVRWPFTAPLGRWLGLSHETRGGARIASKTIGS